jgi:type II secretion system protein H
MRTSATGRPAFTLIELLVVLVLMVVAAGLIAPRIGRSIGDRQLVETAARFAHTARTARELAVARQEVFAIAVDLDRGGYGVTMSSREGGGAMTDVQLSWLKASRWPEGVALTGYLKPDRTTATSGVQQLTFLPDGSSSGARLRFALTGAASGTTSRAATVRERTRADAREVNVIVQPHSGRVIVTEGDVSAIPSDQIDLGD